jgi:pilus assembly protein CpaF
MSMYSESLRAFLRPVVAYLDDETVTEIMINGPEDIWIERKGKVSKTDARFSEEGLIGAARNMAQFVGRQLTDERPRLDARLPDGSRIHVVLPPIARKGTTIAIRKFFKDKLTPQSLINFGSITPEMVRIIEACVRIKLNLLVSGGTGSGKTTLLNILSSLIPDDERILTIEDSAELQLSQAHLVPFESRPPDKFGKGEVNMGHLLQSALRLRPDRIIVGEVRGGEAFDLMQAMNTGHGGSMATAHANTPTDSLRRIESLCLMSAVEMPLVAVRAQVASAINFIVCCERLQDGSRKTIAVSDVLPLNDKGDYRTQDLWLYVPVSKDAEGNVLGYHAPTGILPAWLPKARAYGFEDLDERYFDPATYGVPPPPLLHGVGENVKTHWAPSLRHRERGVPDPSEFEDQWHEFEKKLKAQAGEKGSKGVNVKAADVDPKPKANAPTPAKPMAKVTVSARPSNDATPPPTRNPLMGRKPEQVPELADSLSDDDLMSASMADIEDVPSEPNVQVDSNVFKEAVSGEPTSIRPNPLNGPRKPAPPRPGAAPARPVGSRPPVPRK